MLSVDRPYFRTGVHGAGKVLCCGVSTDTSVFWQIRDATGQVVKSAATDHPSPCMNIDCSDLDSWSPDSPALYSLEMYDGDHLFARTKVGFAEYSTSGDRILLNGRPIYIRGYIRGLKAHEHDNFCFQDTQDFYKKNVRMAKEYGFNYVRWHSTVPDEAFLSAADELGMLVHVEFSFESVWGMNSCGHRCVEDVKFDRNYVIETINRVSAHPSVAVICLGNEIRRVGRRSTVAELAREVKALAPNKLILDNCGWGEYDRESSDIFCQHMGYYFPYGNHRDMFNVLDVFALDGSVNQNACTVSKSEISISKPLIAHEALHYIEWPDTEQLEKDLADPAVNVNRLPKPWWLDELKKLEEAKGITGERRKRVLAASNRFHEVCTREALERIRMSPILQGYMMLQFADTNHYENRNGIVDFFDNPKFISSRDLLRVNADCVVMADLETRCFCSGTEQSFDVWLSDFSNDTDSFCGDLKISISANDAVLQECCRKDIPLGTKGLQKLDRAAMMLPDVQNACRLSLDIVLTTEAGHKVENSYDIWCFPAAGTAKTITHSEGTCTEGSVTISDYLDENLLQKVVHGAKVLWLYNPSKHPCPASSYYMPYVEDHWKPVIWDRGHQMGGVVADSPVLGDYPHDGCLDFQFARLVEGAVKINLDGFLDQSEPVVEGLDRPVRDRTMVVQKKVTGFDPRYYMRRLGYVLNLSIGTGTLLICTFNLDDDTPESRYMYGQLLGYLESAPADSGQIVEEALFRAFLKSAPEGGRLPETAQNEYWQRDDEPVESALFWEEFGIDITKL